MVVSSQILFIDVVVYQQKGEERIRAEEEQLIADNEQQMTHLETQLIEEVVCCA